MAEELGSPSSDAVGAPPEEPPVALPVAVVPHAVFTTAQFKAVLCFAFCTRFDFPGIDACRHVASGAIEGLGIDLMTAVDRVKAVVDRHSHDEAMNKLKTLMDELAPVATPAAAPEVAPESAPVAVELPTLVKSVAIGKHVLEVVDVFRKDGLPLEIVPYGTPTDGKNRAWVLIVPCESSVQAQEAFDATALWPNRIAARFISGAHVLIHKPVDSRIGALDGYVVHAPTVGRLHQGKLWDLVQMMFQAPHVSTLRVVEKAEGVIPTFEEMLSELDGVDSAGLLNLSANSKRAKAQGTMTGFQSGLLIMQSEINQYIRMQEESECMLYRLKDDGPELADFPQSVWAMKGIIWDFVKNRIVDVTLYDAFYDAAVKLYMMRSIFFIGRAGSGKS